MQVHTCRPNLNLQSQQRDTRTYTHMHSHSQSRIIMKMLTSRIDKLIPMVWKIWLTLTVTLTLTFVRTTLSSDIGPICFFFSPICTFLAIPLHNW